MHGTGPAAGLDIPHRVADEDGALGTHAGLGQRHLDDAGVRFGLLHIRRGGDSRHDVIAVERGTQQREFARRRGGQDHLQVAGHRPRSRRAPGSVVSSVAPAW